MADNRNNLPEYSVSEISQAVKRTLEGAFERVRVRGEISGFKRAASGHLYFALKDEEAKLDAVCWRLSAGRLAVTPEDGLEALDQELVGGAPGIAGDASRRHHLEAVLRGNREPCRRGAPADRVQLRLLVLEGEIEVA